MSVFNRFKCFTSYENFCDEFEKVNTYSDSLTEFILTFDRLWSTTGSFNDMLDYLCGFYPNLKILVVNINYFSCEGIDIVHIHHIPEGLEELWLIGNQQMTYDFTYTQTNDLKLLVTEISGKCGLPDVCIPKDHSYDYLDLLDTSNKSESNRCPAHIIEKIGKYEYGYFDFDVDVIAKLTFHPKECSCLPP
jgi:hypothetical protein